MFLMNYQHCRLGLLFQNDAKWTSHINKINKKAGSRLNRLRMLKHILNRSALIKIYSAFIRPIIEYESIVWTTVQRKTQSFQKMHRLQQG